MTKKDYSCDASVIDWPLGAKDDLREKLEAFKETLLAEDSEADVDDEMEILQKNLRRFAECPQLLQMITSGMACGPVSYSVYFGFDLFAPYSKFYEEEE